MNNRVLFLILLLIFFNFSCNKEFNIPANDSFLSTFDSLTSEKDTLNRGQSTKITALATGDKMVFRWYATDGDILGSGNQITYIASPCCTGNSTITCEVSAVNRSESKSVIITILE